jgi:NADH oxidase (H2O2-forming)
LIHGADVTSVGSASVLTAGGTKFKFDSAVIATGGEFLSDVFPGRRKPGVFVLDGIETYEELGRQRSSMAHIVIRGEGIHALELADRLSGTGAKVTLLAGTWTGWFGNRTFGNVVSDAGARKDVSILDSNLESAVGCGQIEAVVAGRVVIPCDALVVMPGRIPRVPRTSSQAGPSGGLLVDQYLSSSSPASYAAGACAEPRTGSPYAHTLEGAAVRSGRVAGANATGDSIVFHPPRNAEASFFGLRWAKVGVSLAEAQARGSAVSEVSRRWSQESACTIAFERPSGKVLGVELITGERNEGQGALASITSLTSLRAAAYGISDDSSDISLVSETARLGLQAWSGS